MIEALKSDEIVNKVGGRFKLTALIQKRMLELMDGARPLVERGQHDRPGGRHPGDPPGQDRHRLRSQRSPAAGRASISGARHMPLLISDEALRAAGLDESSWRVEIACRLFDASKLTLWKAAKLANLTRLQMESALHNAESRSTVRRSMTWRQILPV